MAQRAKDSSAVITAAENRALVETQEQLRAMRAWKAGWNGYDALPPDPGALNRADSWIKVMHRAAESTGHTWIVPYVTASANGEAVFEWWRDVRKLTIYVSPQAVEFVKVWGPDIVNEMADGDAESAATCRDLWLWLTS